MKERSYLKPLLLLTFETSADRELLSISVQRLSLAGSAWLGQVGGLFVALYALFWLVAQCGTARFLKMGVPHAGLIEQIFKIDNFSVINPNNGDDNLTEQARKCIENRARVPRLTYL